LVAGSGPGGEKGNAADRAGEAHVQQGGTVRERGVGRGSSPCTQIYYANYPYLLHEEIYDRSGKKGDFKEQEIWYLLLSLLEAKRQAEDNATFLNDVRPKNIFLNQEGLIKTATPFSWPLSATKYQKSLDKVATYLAPEEVALLEMGATDFAKVAPTAEIFSIGLTLLSVGNLEDYEGLYNLETFKLDTAKLGSAISHWITKFNYSEVLRATVINLCAEDPARRMTAE
jgi:serine/threonine protein kinase